MDLETITSFQTLVRLEYETSNSDDLLRLLRSNGLVKSRGKRCCNREMHEGPGKSGLFGKVWRCAKCRGTRTLVSGSFFEGSQLHPFTILRVAYAYIAVRLQHEAMRSLMDDVPTSPNLCDWSQFCRDVLSKDLLGELSGQTLGGPGKIIVVKETTIEKMDHVGFAGKKRVAREIRILGFYDVENKVGLTDLIEDHSDEIIIQRIEEQVAQGTEIITDNLSMFECLSDKGFVHNRSPEFVGQNGAHTNHIKSYFKRMKEFLKKRDVKRPSTIPSYLDEFMWMERHRSDPWASFIRALRQQLRNNNNNKVRK